MPHVRDTRPLPKRRKLNPAVLLTTPTPPSLAKNLKPAAGVCASCHRAQAAAVSCARCAAATCAICARRCTATATPVLALNHSPRRLALANTNTNTGTNGHANANVDAAPGAAKRKKLREDEGDAEERVEDGSGCGRTVCRACCFETPQESTTCYDCEAI